MMNFLIPFTLMVNTCILPTPLLFPFYLFWFKWVRLGPHVDFVTNWQRIQHYVIFTLYAIITAYTHWKLLLNIIAAMLAC